MTHGPIEIVYPGDGQKFYRVDVRMIPSAGQLVQLVTQESLDHIPLDTLERARLEGEGAHQVACGYSLCLLTGEPFNKETWPPMPPEYQPGMNTWVTVMLQTIQDVTAFFKQYHVRPLAVEQPAVNLIYGLGGQVDLLCDLTWKGKDYRSVVDYKRVAVIMWGMRLKIACYRMLYQDCKKGFLLHFKKAGGYELIEIPDDPVDRAGLLGAAAVLRARANGKR